MKGVLTKVRDLQPGNMVDLEGDKYADIGDNTFSELYGVVGYVQEETPECWVVGIEHVDSFGFPPDHEVPVVGNITLYSDPS